MIFSRAGFKVLKFAYIVLLAGLGAGAFIVVGTYLYWQTEKKNDLQSQSALQDLRGRLSTALRDREDLRGSEDTYKMLAARGVFNPEERFDLIETLAALKSRHQLVSLGYELAPQRPLRLSQGVAYTGVNLFASHVKLKIRALHDGHLIAFLDEFPRLQRGFFPFDRCAIKRNAPLGGIGTSPDTSQTPPATPAPAVPTLTSSLADALEAECSFEWLTLQPKGGGAVTPVVSPAVANPRT